MPRAHILSDDVRTNVDFVLRQAERRGLDNAKLAIAAEIEAETLRKYRITDHNPAPPMMGLDKALRLIGALVDEGHRDLASQLVAGTGCELTQPDPEAANLHAVGAACAGMAATICTAAADGKFDHREKAAIREAAAPLVSMLQDVASMGGAHG